MTSPFLLSLRHPHFPTGPRGPSSLIKCFTRWVRLRWTCWKAEYTIHRISNMQKKNKCCKRNCQYGTGDSEKRRLTIGYKKSRLPSSFWQTVRDKMVLIKFPITAHRNLVSNNWMLTEGLSWKKHMLKQNLRLVYKDVVSVFFFFSWLIGKFVQKA